MSQLNGPHGGKLKDLVVSEERKQALKQEAKEWPSFDLTLRQVCDVEMLISGSYSPLTGFMTKAEVASVCDSGQLPDGTIWPLPISLDVPEAVAETLEPGSVLALRDPEGDLIAVLHVEETWQADRAAESRALHGTDDPAHPGVDRLLNKLHPWCVAGRLEGAQLPVHYDFGALRRTPTALRAELEAAGWSKVLGFATESVMHRAECGSAGRVAAALGANLLLHPVVGATSPSAIDDFARVRSYQAILPHLPDGGARLVLSPASVQMGGAREIVLWSIVLKNHGCSHSLVPSGDAAAWLGDRAAGLGIELVTDDAGEPWMATSLEQQLERGDPLPADATFPEVQAILEEAIPPRRSRGFTVFLTGLSGSGKSTVANALVVKLQELGGRRVTLLDGDKVRKHLSSELNFSKEHRDINIRRIGYVASEITKNGGIAVCAPIAPYDRVRKDVREMVEAVGGFVLVHVATPLEVCEARDRKGLYAKARAGIIKEFTGISDPYEEPADAEVRIHTTERSAAEEADALVEHLRAEGYLAR